VTACSAGAILAIMPTLAVLGAGPKGIAIAAKARALTAAGLAAPRVVLIEPGPVAGNWTGRQGYTSGLLPLGTPPEKDVGYPYADSWGPRSPAVTAAMADYSWQRHLIARGAYADWVDRGRLRPTHRQWSYCRATRGPGRAARSFRQRPASRIRRRRPAPRYLSA
jgi:mycobactin lysine-N-oxygenase